VDLSASDPVMRRQYKEILGFVRRRTGTSADAEDITQEVFASAAEQLSRSTSSAPPTLGWLYTVARRRLVDEARQRRRPETVSLELVREPEAESEYGDSVARAFDSALGRLTEGQRVVVLLRLLEGRSFAEIARRVAATEEACRMRFMRGLEQLRTELEREGITP
jgi:RNA polymerase sigma-70 factor (ECF subfamily)